MNFEANMDYTVRPVLEKGKAVLTFDLANRLIQGNH